MEVATETAIDQYPTGGVHRDTPTGWAFPSDRWLECPAALTFRAPQYLTDEVLVSYGTSGGGRQTKNDRREAAREKARVLREQQKKRERRTRFLLQGSIIVASLAIIAIIAVVIVNSSKPAGPGPLNMASDGIQISKGGVALPTPALASGATPVANPVNTASGAVDIQIYVDYLCPICGQFESTNGSYLTSLIDNGAATLEIHPISILDRSSQGTKYSTRAANAAACVANYSPNQYYDFHNLLYSNQPQEGSTGLTDDELISLTVQAKATNLSAIATCVQKQDFSAWVTAATNRALTGPIPNSNVDKVQGTPTVIVNGQKYTGSVSDATAFQSFVIQAAGNTGNESSTPTPTPTP
jgi:protein-disulfide isomerase